MSTTTTPLRRLSATTMLKHLASPHGRELAIFAGGALLLNAALAAATIRLTPLEEPGDTAPPVPPSMAVRALPPEVALKVNNAIPVTSDVPAASPFRFAGSSAARLQATQCLAEAVYYEAGSESVDGQRAVAQVVLNRVRHPAFPASVCGVVYQGSTRLTGCQFTFTCDGSLTRAPDAAGWRRASDVAKAALAGSVFTPVGWATHYHAAYVVPYWASSMAKNAVQGLHLFYRWSGAWGRPAAFSEQYRGTEASASALRGAALAAFAARPPLEAAEAVLTDLKGVEVLPLTPSMRGDKRVAVRFNEVAREAADEGAKKAEAKPYSERVDASDNLRWSLSEDPAGAAQQPLGTKKAESGGTPPPPPPQPQP